MPDRVLSVSQINTFIKRLLEGSAVLRRVVVEGEIVNYRPAASGHLYFSLADERSQISCVMWRSDATSLAFPLENGLKVKLTGAVRVYERAGTYQIQAVKIEKAGIGNLFLEMERVRREIEALGWTNPERKREIPKEIRKIGLVTSRTGAAVTDIITTLRRRNPNLEILLAPASVQGESAPEEIAQAIRDLNAHGGLDVLIVGRGGGSIEELNAFNTFPVLEALHESKIPTISAVGHERDVLLSDFVADLRAPTPTAAAELVSINLRERIEDLILLRREMELSLYDTIRSQEMHLDLLTERIQSASPKARILRVSHRRDAAVLSLKHGIDDKLRLLTARLEKVQDLTPLIDRKLTTSRHRYEKIEQELLLLNPLSKFDKGFVYVTGPDGQAVKHAPKAKALPFLTLHFKDGEVRAVPERENG